MRKILSLMMALAMIISVFSAVTITASANATWSGELTFNGESEDSIDSVEALYFETAPTIDGYVTEAEWGEKTIELSSEYMGTAGLSQSSYYNTFFYWKSGDETTNPMAALIWLRWDEENFYVAAIVRDYSGHSLKHGKTEAWNGDSLQFRVDSKGANAATGGDVYDPNIGTPWSADEVVPDFVVGYVQIAGGFVECFENTNDKGLTEYSKPIFGAAQVAVAPSEENADNPLNYHEDAKAGYTTYEVAIPWKYIFENDVVANATPATAKKDPYLLTYSDYNPINGKKGGIGRNLGMSITIFDAAKGESSWKSFISWGSGITSVQVDVAHEMCGGSNEVILSGDKVVQGEYAKYDPKKLEPSMASKVYDNKFFDYLGGDLTCANPLNSASALTTLTYDNETDLEYWGSADLYDGSIDDVGGDHGKVLEYDRALKDYTIGDDTETVYKAGIAPIDKFYIDTTIIPPDEDGKNGEAWTYPLSYTFEMDVMYTGVETVDSGYASSLGNWFGGANAVEYYCGYSFVDKCFVICDYLACGKGDYIAMSKTFDLKQDTWYNWKFQYDNDTCTVRLLINDEEIFNVNNRYFYYSNEQHLNDGTMMIMWFINTQLKMDNVKVYNFYDYLHKASDNVDDTVQGNPNTPSTPSNPGNTGNNGGDTGNNGGNTGNVGGNTGNVGGNTGNSGNTGNVGGNTGNVGGNTGNSGNTGNVGGNTGNVGGNTGNVGGNTGNVGGNTGNSGNTGNAGNNGTTNKPVTEQGGQDIVVDKDQVAENEDGTFKVAVKAKAEYKTATELTYTFKINADKFELVEIAGLNKNDYKLEQGEDGTYTLTVTNIAKVKAAAAGATLFEIVLKGKDGATADDLADAKTGIEIKDSFKYTSVATGDNMFYVAILAAVMLAGCAVVAYKKQRNF